MKKFFIISLALFSGVMCNAQQTKLLSAEKHNEYGLVYSLPTTAFQIDVVAVKETFVAAPFGAYSKIFTNDAQPVTESDIKWSIESVRVSPYGVADEENQYLMQLKPGALTYLCVAQDGMLIAINKETSLPTLQPLTFLEKEGDIATGKEYLKYVDEDFLSAQSSYKKAQLLAEELIDIRDAKISLTRGTAETMPTDGKQLELMLASLDNQEKSLINAFLGSSWKERTLKTYTVVPDKEGKFVVARLSRTDGLVDADDLSGEPIYLTVTNPKEAELPVDSKGEEKKFPKDGVVYCVPGTADILLSFRGENLFSKNFPMSQFGYNFALNPAIFTDKKEPSFAVFDPATGALLEIGVMK